MIPLESELFPLLSLYQVALLKKNLTGELINANIFNGNDILPSSPQKCVVYNQIHIKGKHLKSNGLDQLNFDLKMLLGQGSLLPLKSPSSVTALEPGGHPIRALYFGDFFLQNRKMEKRLRVLEQGHNRF